MVTPPSNPDFPSDYNVSLLQTRIAELERQLEQCQMELQQEREHHQQSVSFDQHQLQAILNNAPVPIFVKDTEGQYLMMNPAYEEVIGYQQDELLGRTDYDIFPIEVGDRCWRSDQTALSAQQAITSEEQVLVANELHTLLVTKFKIVDASGNLSAVCGMMIDITEQKRAEAVLRQSEEKLSKLFERQQSEEALRQSEEHLRLAMEATRMGSWSVNLITGEEIWSDQSQVLLGFTPGTFDGKTETFLSRIHPDDRAIVEASTQKALQIGTKEVKYRVVLDDQTIRWIVAKGKVFYDEMHTPAWISGVNIDISDCKRTEVQLWESLQEKEVLLKEIHHRVKNNLQIISSLLRRQSRQAENHQTATLFQEAQNRVQSMALIHEQLYQSPDLSRINFGQYLGDLIQHLFRSYGVDQQYISLVFETDELYLTLNTAIPCGLIINELVSNALKYAFPTEQPGEIVVRLRSTDSNSVSQITITVEDNGIGIPERIVWETTQSLGLRIVRNLVIQLHGTIAVDREHGTRFQIHFPNFLQRLLPHQ